MVTIIPRVFQFDAINITEYPEKYSCILNYAAALKSGWKSGITVTIDKLAKFPSYECVKLSMV